MKRAAWSALTVLLGAVQVWAFEAHSADGVVVSIDAAHSSVVISCDAIPDYMDPMEMPFLVRNVKALAGLKPGEAVRFDMIERGKKFYAEEIQAARAENFETEPMEAGGLTMLHDALNASAGAKVLAVGQRVPDFTLTDQAGKEIHFSQLQGRVVALTFGYSRCPNPNYCFRLSSNLASVEKRFQKGAGSDLILLTIAIDPEHDQGEVLKQYANTWKADPSYWHFLTGPLPEIRQVAALFGMNFWRDGGLLTHSLHTVIIDRKGELAANIEGNQFTAKQLGDLVQTVMDRPQ